MCIVQVRSFPCLSQVMKSLSTQCLQTLWSPPHILCFWFFLESGSNKQEQSDLESEIPESKSKTCLLWAASHSISRINKHKDRWTDHMMWRSAFDLWWIHSVIWTHLVTHCFSVAYKCGEVFAVLSEQFVRKLFVQEGVTPSLHIVWLWGCERVPAVAHQHARSFGDVDFCKTLAADPCLSEQEITAHREHGLQVPTDRAHQVRLI